MARIKNGLLGDITGTIGNIEGYMLNGRLILRTRRAKSSKPPTQKQLACRMRMRVVKRFLGAFIEFVRIGFTYSAKNKIYNPHEAAVGWQLKNAITGEYPDITIDYSKVRVTEGPMDTQGINAVARMEDKKLIFTWTPDFSYVHSTDCVMLLAYAPGLNEAVYKLCGAKRSTGTDELILAGDNWGEGIAVETYLSFIKEHGTICTNSIYTGSFRLE
ncbi:hypothetical protein SAMN05518672_113151 [Chitinophaga sp. CF118]|uniref:DUF6266 family protein n=1 Tax=Chitinophaga sp. CF118 TaxID=1884367 RepID=UPI0008EB334D|nr:DUF6266 family protein [Chitinophaga sp. CF118]SFE98361.1 hypothetical protein SAMN05518672_113151 [Chitinophaga sp. CF118]